MNAKSVRDILASLDGKVYETREAVEDAVFPMWAKLSAVFHGEGHRDLVDRLINARWLEFIQGKWKFFLPAEEKFGAAIEPETPKAAAVEPTKPVVAPVAPVTTSSSQADIAFATEITLSVEDIALMNAIPKGNLVMTPQLENLIKVGMVIPTFVLTNKGQRALEFANQQSLTFKIQG